MIGGRTSRSSTIFLHNRIVLLTPIALSHPLDVFALAVSANVYCLCDGTSRFSSDHIIDVGVNVIVFVIVFVNIKTTPW